jgi:hypothetical protein
MSVQLTESHQLSCDNALARPHIYIGVFPLFIHKSSYSQHHGTVSMLYTAKAGISSTVMYVTLIQDYKPKKKKKLTW